MSKRSSNRTEADDWYKIGKMLEGKLEKKTEGPPPLYTYKADCSDQIIAEHLGVSKSSVELQRKRLYGNLIAPRSTKVSELEERHERLAKRMLACEEENRSVRRYVEANIEAFKKALREKEKAST